MDNSVQTKTSLSTKNKLLNTAASISQKFDPLNQICGHLNAFHAYAADLSRCVETNHYCAHINEDMRQCILYDGSGPGARIIGVEYMISPKLYATLEPRERALWHSHVYEVKSGVLIMPGPDLVPDDVWQVAESMEMETLVNWYGKVYHLWQVDRGDTVPLGEPQLMTSFVKDGQLEQDKINDRDGRYGVSSEEKKGSRVGIKEPDIHPDADSAWKSKSV